MTSRTSTSDPRPAKLTAIRDALTRAVADGYTELAPAADDLTAACALNVAGAVHNLDMGLRDGIKGANLGATGGGSGDASPIERILIGPVDDDESGDWAWSMSRDTAYTDLAQLDDAIRHLTDKLGRLHQRPHQPMVHDARTVWRIIQQWAPRKATSKDLREVAAANAQDGCTNHARIGVFEPVHRTGTVGGNLALPAALCSSCYDQVRRNGKVPTGEWMERRQRTGKNEMERIT